MGASGSTVDEPPRQARIDDIEVLRAVAVAMVLVEHVRINLIPWIWGVREPLYKLFGFWSGVDLFLAISGFVIARSLLPSLQSATDVRRFFAESLAFWVRRIWRLLPSAWLWLVVIVVCAAAFNRSGAFQPLKTNIEGAIAAALNVANFRIAIIGIKHPLGASFPYWSLSLEEQFYLVLPFLVFLTRRRLPLALCVIVGLQLFITRSGPDAHGLFNQTRSDALSLGVLLAIWSSKPSYQRLEPKFLQPWAVRMLLPLGLVVVFAYLSGNPYEPARFRVGEVALLAAGVVWIASYGRDYLFPPGRVKRAFCWLGARSYAVYLIHIPVFFATREFWFRVRPDVLMRDPGHFVILLATALPLLVGLAELNYRCVERPLRRYGVAVAERIRHRSILAAGGASVRPTFAAPAGFRVEDAEVAE